ncbi:MAG TPA: response regulator transcription factor [Terriglobales bacterium]|nr:response regulator transcription factor [Terriglobales bacterium]
MIRIRLVASSPLVRAGLEAMLREMPGFAVLSPGENSLSARADVQLMESASGTGRSARYSGFIGDDAPPTVLLADDLGRADLRRALHAGVRAVLPRDAAAPEIIAAIQAAAAGLIVLSSEDMDALLPAEPEKPTSFVPGETLTSREMQVLGMLAEGLGNKDIAARLKISEHTVKFHVSSILGKLGATTRGEAVARGMREGLVVI